MQIVGGLLALIYAIAMVAGGISGAPMWLPLAGAFAAVGIYLMLRPRAVQMILEQWHASGVPSVCGFAVELYVFQLLLRCSCTALAG
jgi:hypothetical protein